MSYISFLKAIFDGALFGIAVSTVGWVLGKIHYQNKRIKEILSQIEDLEEELKDCEKELSQF